MTSPPMTKRQAFRELVVLGAAYAIGLWAILIGLTDLPAGQIPSLLVGLGVFIASSAALFLALSRGRLSLDLGRPLRYWIPVGVAVVVAVSWSARLQDPVTPDVATYAVAIPLLIGGRCISNLWWSTATPARLDERG
jgi:hypothetical protein